LFEQGVAAMQAEHPQEAVDLFRRSFAIVERPATAYNLAVALERTGRVRDAVAALEEYFRVAPEDDGRRSDAAAMRTDLTARIVDVTLRVEPEDATVEIDGEAREETGAERNYVLDPGSHTLVISADGFVTETLLVAASGAQEVSLARPVLSREEARAASGADDPMPWIVVGASAGVAVVGAILLAVGRVDAATVENAEMGSPWADVAEAAERSPILSGTGIALMGVGVAGAALGIVWATTRGGESSVAIGPGTLHLRGRF
jgi:hypothetical protein